METQDQIMLTVQCVVALPAAKAWEYWTGPDHIVNWNSASEDWFTPRAENELQVGGKFSFRMEARDGSMGFDFWGTYDEVREHEFLAYTLGDGRKVDVRFSPVEGGTAIVERFVPESVNTHDLQLYGWQAIVNNYKKYAEAQG